MRPIGIIRAGARAVATGSKLKNKASPRPSGPNQIEPTSPSNKDNQDPKHQIENYDLGDEVEGVVNPNDFSGRVHSESYSQQNLSAAFEQLILSNQTLKPSEDQTSKLSQSSSKIIKELQGKDVAGAFKREKRAKDSKVVREDEEEEEEDGFKLFKDSIKFKTLKTIKDYQSSIMSSLSLDDPSGRIYSKNVRQMKEILSFEKWRKNIYNNSNSNNETGGVGEVKKSKIAESYENIRMMRKEMFDRPSIVDKSQIRDLIFNFWRLDQLESATILVSYAGHPYLIDELLKLKNVKKVIAIEEFPEYCIMYTDRWKEEIEKKRFYHIKNDGYWWESYSEVEDLGLLDDLDIVPFEQRHNSFFFICQLPHLNRSIQFLMQILSFIPNKNWLFQYGNFNLSFICSGKLFNKFGRVQSDKKYSRINATLNCLVDFESYNVNDEKKDEEGLRSRGSLEQDSFFPNRWINKFELSTSSNSTMTKNKKKEKKKGINSKTNKKIYKSSIDYDSLDFSESILIRPKLDLDLSLEEFDCLNFLQRLMFVHSASPWVESISHAAAGASIMYEKLKSEGKEIPRGRTVREMSDKDWINLSKSFNRWPFKPRSFENDLELDLDESNGI